MKLTFKLSRLQKILWLIVSLIAGYILKHFMDRNIVYATIRAPTTFEQLMGFLFYAIICGIVFYIILLIWNNIKSKIFKTEKLNYKLSKIQAIFLVIISLIAGSVLKYFIEFWVYSFVYGYIPSNSPYSQIIGSLVYALISGVIFYIILFIYNNLKPKIKEITKA